LQPKSALPHLRLADVAWQRNNLSAEAANVRRALELEPDSPEALRAMLGVVLREKQPAKALSLARSVQARNEAAAVGYALEGEVEFHLEHFDAAVAAFRKAMARNGGADVAPRLHLAWLRAGQVAEAKQFAEAWLREHPNDGVFIEHLGAEALARRDWAAAQARYEALLQRQPRQVMAMNNLALALASQRKAGAVEWAERAVAAAPNQPALLDTLAMAYASDDQFEQAVEQQRKAVALAPQAAGLRLNLARLLLQAGAKTDARAELEQLQKLGAAFGEQAEVQRLIKSLGA